MILRSNHSPSMDGRPSAQRRISTRLEQAPAEQRRGSQVEENSPRPNPAPSAPPSHAYQLPPPHGQYMPPYYARLPYAQYVPQYVPHVPAPHPYSEYASSLHLRSTPVTETPRLKRSAARATQVCISDSAGPRIVNGCRHASSVGRGSKNVMKALLVPCVPKTIWNVAIATHHQSSSLCPTV